MPIRRHPVAVGSRSANLRAWPVDSALVTRLRRVFELIRPHSQELGRTFYERLFATAPQLRSLFRSSSEEQAEKLVQSLSFVVENLEAPEKNMAYLAELGRRHASYGARAEHYDLVIELLIESMKRVLGAGADVQSLEEWRMALRLISDQMIAAAP